MTALYDAKHRSPFLELLLIIVLALVAGLILTAIASYLPPSLRTP